MDSKIFNLSLPQELISLINNQAKLNYMSRNEYIKQAIVTRLKLEGILDLSRAATAAEATVSALPSSSLISNSEQEIVPPTPRPTKDGRGGDIQLKNFLHDYNLENPGTLDFID